MAIDDKEVLQANTEYQHAYKESTKYYELLFKTINTYIVFLTSITIFGINGDIIIEILGGIKVGPYNDAEEVVFFFLIPFMTYIFGLFYCYYIFAISKIALFMSKCEQKIQFLSYLANSNLVYEGWESFARKNRMDSKVPYMAMVGLQLLIPLLSIMYGIWHKDVSTLLSNKIYLFVFGVDFVFYLIYIFFIAKFIFSTRKMLGMAKRLRIELIIEGVIINVGHYRMQNKDWEKICNQFKNKNRLKVEAIFWLYLHKNSTWDDLPEVYGSRKGVKKFYKRMTKKNQGIFSNVVKMIFVSDDKIGEGKVSIACDNKDTDPIKVIKENWHEKFAVIYAGKEHYADMNQERKYELVNGVWYLEDLIMQKNRNVKRNELKSSNYLSALKQVTIDGSYTAYDAFFDEILSNARSIIIGRMRNRYIIMQYDKKAREEIKKRLTELKDDFNKTIATKK